MPTGKRAANRAFVESEILRVGRDHLAEVGAAALSLRAIARELGMVSSAVYRYVESRDELLTRLIIDAYDSLGDFVDAALEDVDGVADRPVRQRFALLCRAIRGWAVAHPHQYALIYGSPVPQYQAPADRTNVAGNRIPTHFVAILKDAPSEVATGDPAALAADARELVGVLEAEPLFAELGLSAESLARGYAAWSLVFGALSTELFEQLGPDAIPDPSVHFDAVVAMAADLVLGATPS